MQTLKVLYPVSGEGLPCPPIAADFSLSYCLSSLLIPVSEILWSGSKYSLHLDTICSSHIWYPGNNYSLFTFPNLQAFTFQPCLCTIIYLLGAAIPFHYCLSCPSEVFGCAFQASPTPQDPFWHPFCVFSILPSFPNIATLSSLVEYCWLLTDWSPIQAVNTMGLRPLLIQSHAVQDSSYHIIGSQWMMIMTYTGTMVKPSNASKII